MKSIKKTSKSFLFLFFLILSASYFVLSLLNIPLIPCFVIAVVFHIVCILLPEIIDNIIFLKISAYLYCAASLIFPACLLLPSQLFFIGPALVYVLLAGCTLYPIPLYLLVIRKEQDCWQQWIISIAAMFFAIEHLILFIIFSRFSGWHELAV